jgi:hypothetical protein
MAAQAREHLLHMDLGGKKLKVEYATPSRDTINRNISAELALVYTAFPPLYTARPLLT